MLYPQQMLRNGIHLLRALVGVGIIAVLVGLILPFFYRINFQASRLKNACHLMVLGGALHSYHSKNQSFPLGFDPTRQKSFYWALAGEFDASLINDVNAGAKPFSAFLSPGRRTPSSCSPGTAPADYGFAASTNSLQTVLGGAGANNQKPVSLREISNGDGTENTLMATLISIKPADYGGVNGVDSPWPTTNYGRDMRRLVQDSAAEAGPPRMGSPYRGAMSCLFASGSVRTVSYDIDDENMQRLWTFNADDQKDWNPAVPAP